MISSLRISWDRHLLQDLRNHIQHGGPAMNVFFFSTSLLGDNCLPCSSLSIHGRNQERCSSHIKSRKLKESPSESVTTM